MAPLRTALIVLSCLTVSIGMLDLKSNYGKVCASQIFIHFADHARNSQPADFESGKTESYAGSSSAKTNNQTAHNH